MVEGGANLRLGMWVSKIGCGAPNPRFDLASSSGSGGYVLIPFYQAGLHTNRHAKTQKTPVLAHFPSQVGAVHRVCLWPTAKKRNEKKRKPRQ